MLFVTVGTTDFDALIRRVDDLAPRISDDLVCQIGGGRYIPRNCDYFRFAPSLADYIERARLIISHGGQGSVMDVVRTGKPLVGVSNPDRRDHHQDDILGKFEELHHLIWCRSLNDLEDSISRASQTGFAQYVDPACGIQDVIGDFLLGTKPRRK